MHAHAHARLMTMVDAGELQFAAADPLRVCRLRREADAHVLWATASAEADDLAGAFRLAYRASGEYATAMLLAAGLEPVDDEVGRLLFRAAATMAGSTGLRRAVRRADDLRRVDLAWETGFHELERSDVDEALAVGETLGRHLAGVVEERYPGMLSQHQAG